MRFPTSFNRSVRVPGDYLSNVLSQVLTEVERGEKKFFRSSIGGLVGATLEIQLIPEGEVSSLIFSFNYGRFMIAIASLFLLFIFIPLCFFMLLNSHVMHLIVPTVIAGLVSALIIIYYIGHKIDCFLIELDNILLGLESEYAREKMSRDKARWESSPKNVDDLYRRLCEKYVKTWGSTYILEYKIKEYRGQGLTRDEAIRKISEEEGIF